MHLTCLTRCFLGISFCMVFSTSAFGQYGQTPSNGGVSTKGGYRSAPGIGIGAGAAAAVGIAYLAFHNRGSLLGCVETSRSGMKLMNEKDKNTYTLVANGDYLKAGERVALKGKKTKDGAGRRIFLVQKLTNDYGPCRQ